MSIQYANDAKSYLASAVEAIDTTIEVVSVELLPVLADGDEMYLTIADNLNAASEIVKCTSINGTTLTVVRGHEDSTARAWPIGSDVQLRITAGLLSNLLVTKTDLTVHTSALVRVATALTNTQTRYIARFGFN